VVAQGVIIEMEIDAAKRFCFGIAGARQVNITNNVSVY